MSIIRVSKRERWATIDNTCLNDERLSYQEVGLLAYLLSKPDSWVVRLSQLVGAHTNGRDAVYNIVNSLVDKGYMTKTAVRDESGRFTSYNYVVFESPQELEALVEESPLTEKPYAVNPDSVSPASVKPSLVKTNTRKDGEEEKTDIAAVAVKPKSRKTDPIFDALAQAWLHTSGGEYTSAESGRIVAGKRDLAVHNPTPDEILLRGRRWDMRHPDIPASPQVLVGHWRELGSADAPQERRTYKEEQAGRMMSGIDRVVAMKKEYESGRRPVRQGHEAIVGRISATGSD